MGSLSPWHLLIIAACFVMLFGAKKLPDAARSLGRSARIMKSELTGLHEDATPAKRTEPEVLAAAVTPPIVVEDVTVAAAARDNGRR